MIKDLRDFLSTKIEEITELTGKGFKSMQSDYASFPAYNLAWTGSPEAEASTLKSTNRTYEFRVRVVVDYGSDSMTPEQAEDLLMDISDKVIDKFEMNRKAGTYGDFLAPVTGNSGYLDNERKLRYADIIIRINARRIAE